MGLMKSDSGYFQCVGESDIGQVYSVAQLIVLDEGEDPVEANMTAYRFLPMDLKTLRGDCPV